MESNSINRHGNPNVTRGYFGGKSHCHPRLVKRRQLRSQLRRKRKAKIVSVSVLSRVLIVMSTNLEHIQKEKDREKEKVGDRPAKLNEKKSDRGLEREIKNKGDIFCWKNNMKKKKKCQRPPRWKWAAVKKKSEQEHVLHFLVKTGNQR